MARPLHTPPAGQAKRAKSIVLRAPARLHLGFLDPAGTLGRRFGSLGLVIDGFETRVELAGAAGPEQITAGDPVAEPEVERAAAILRMLQAQTGRSKPLHLQLSQVLPAHAGFGSGTQLALAIARAFAQWHGLQVPSATLAQWCGRGLRSGIGIAGFDLGGLLVDGGPGAQGAPAPLLARIAFPSAWRVLVVQDRAQRGLSGAEETQRLAALPPLPQELAADICHQVLMRVLPGAAGAQFAHFAAGIERIQQVLGAHFAPAQGGAAYASAAVGRLMQGMADIGLRAARGQSSWGPTGFAIFESQAQADAALDVLHGAGLVGPSLLLRVVSGRNSGATLVDQRVEAAPA